jgi:MoxR-like ATPase
MNREHEHFGQSPENQEEKNSLIIREVVFRDEKGKGGATIYKSSAEGRKSIELIKDSIMPEVGQSYSVEVVEDTNPDNPNKGKYYGKIVLGGKPLTTKAWEQVDLRVDQAVDAQRRATMASAELSAKSKILSEDRKDFSLDELLEKINNRHGRVIKKVADKQVSFQELADSILGPKDSPERVLTDFRFSNLRNALREDGKIRKTRKKLLEEETDTIRDSKNPPSSSEIESLQEIRDELAQLKEARLALTQENPESFYGLHLHDLKDYKKQLRAGNIVETPYVTEQIEELLTHFNAGVPVLIYGHLGSGKTEMALHAAKKYLKKEALVISGSKHTSISELYGHQVLSLDKVNPDELDQFAGQIERKFSDWATEHPEASEQDISLAHERIMQVQLTQLKSGTISDFFLGPIYRAMEEGRPVIIDEVNAIQHETLISLNHVLTRKPGDVVNVQQDSGKTITIQEGFGIIMTGNLNQGQNKYVDRQELDPAFLSRLHKMEHDYLPQHTEGPASEVGEGDDLYHLIVSRVMDRGGNMEVPEDIVELSRLWDLAKAAKVFQNVFAGKEVDKAYYYKEGGSRSVPYFLQESVLSIRALDKIITMWQKEGYKYELDYYLWKEFVGQSTVLSDRAYLYQILKDNFGFFQSDGWPKNPNYGETGKLSSFDINPPKNSSERIVFYSPREVVELAYGEAPERKEWPVYNESEQDVILKNKEKLKELQKYNSGLGLRIDKLKGLIEKKRDI